MALIPSGAWEAAVSFRDNNGKTAAVGFYLPAGLTQLEAQGVFTAVANAMGAVSDAAIIGGSLTRAYAQDTPATPPATSEVERKLRIPLDAGIYRNATAVEVPSPAFTHEISGTDVVDVNSPAIAALLDLLAQGSLGPANGLVTYWGADITATGTPFVTHRNRKKSE